MSRTREHLGSTRREFFRQAACAAVGTIALTNTIRDLRIVSSALAQQSALTDYKAMICIFLAGGNDSNNLVIPRNQSQYDLYKAVRQNLAIDQTRLLPINPTTGDGNEYGLHPRMTKLQTLFQEKKLALVFNAGPLLYPIDRTQYRAKSVPTPPQLFSHSDQVTHWQTSLPDHPPKSGWGGRIADLLHPLQYELVNGQPTAAAAKISLCTSIAGANTFEVGNQVQQYHVSTSGAVTLTGMTASTDKRRRALTDILAITTPNLQRDAYADVVERAIATGDLITTAIAASPTWTTPFPTSGLGNQLKMIARLIDARGALSMKRQIFFCSVGGYDTHTAQVTATDTTSGSHANLLGEVSEALFAFQRAMEQIGLANNVAAFTASDFGRTFPTNGQGSDHGWGSHHLVMGGDGGVNSAVRGGQTYGSFPVLQVNGPDDTSTGRWIPKTSVDEYAATLARWFGVSNTYLGAVFPNLHRFPNPNMGFMAA